MPSVQWLCTLLHGKAKVQGVENQVTEGNPEKKGMHPIRNSRGIAGSGKSLDIFLCLLHELGIVEG